MDLTQIKQQNAVNANGSYEFTLVNRRILTPRIASSAQPELDQTIRQFISDVRHANFTKANDQHYPTDVNISILIERYKEIGVEFIENILNFTLIF